MRAGTIRIESPPIQAGCLAQDKGITMHHYRVTGLFAAFLLNLCIASAVQADTLLLVDGSQLKGRVVRQQGGSLEFETSYAGLIQVQWDQVQTMVTDSPVDLYLQNGQLVSTSRVTRRDGDLEIGAVNDTQTLAAADLKSINPADWERGIGYKMTGRVNAALDFQEGNTDKEELGVDGEVRFRRQHDRLTIAGQFEQDESAGVTTADNWLLNSKYDRFVTDKWYYGGTLRFESDEFADLDLRTAVGPHVGYQFFEGPALNLSIDAAILYVDEDFITTPDNDYTALGWNVDFDKLLLSDRVQVYHRHSGQMETGEASNVVVNSWTGLRFPLYAGINASTEVQADYDGGAPATVDKWDTIYRIKLGYSW